MDDIIPTPSPEGWADLLASHQRLFDEYEEARGVVRAGRARLVALENALRRSRDEGRRHRMRMPMPTPETGLTKTAPRCERIAKLLADHGQSRAREIREALAAIEGTYVSPTRFGQCVSRLVGEGRVRRVPTAPDGDGPVIALV